jgi:hypothetical protein
MLIRYNWARGQIWRAPAARYRDYAFLLGDAGSMSAGSIARSRGGPSFSLQVSVSMLNADGLNKSDMGYFRDSLTFSFLNG